MSVRYTLRMQFGMHLDPTVIEREVLELCRRAQADEVLFFVFAEEQNDGHDSLDRIAQWLAWYRPIKQALEREGIAVSLNPWHTILHCDRHRRLKPDQPWQTMVDWRGQAAQAVVCPLDPGWRSYIRAAFVQYAAERFRVVWVDDDIRLHNHAPLDWGGCFCPLHVAQFNRQAGTNATREEIVHACLAPGEPHPWRSVWFDMWDATQTALVAEWRDIVEAAGSRLGLMSSDLQTHAAEGRRWPAWHAAMARQFPFTHRPSFCSYIEDPPRFFPYYLGQSQMNRMVQPPEVESDPELENVPYGHWNKSYRCLLSQMVMAQVFGADRQCVSLYDFMGNLPSDDAARAAFLGDVKPCLAWLGEEFPATLRAVGIGTPWHEDMGRRSHVPEGRQWQELEVATRGWDLWLCALGRSFQKRPHERVNALSGDMAWTFTDDELKAWLKQGLLLDGPAALILAERGFGEWIGLQNARLITQAEVLYAMEESVDAEFGLRAGARISVNLSKFCQRLLQGELLNGTREISRLLNPTHQRVGHGAYVFENHLGGRVGVVPWSAIWTGAPMEEHMTVQRHAQLEDVLRWLDHGRTCGHVAGGPWLVPQFFTDGSLWRGIIWNIGGDAVREMRVHPPEGMGAIRRAVHCDGQGNRRTAAVRDNVLTFEAPVHQWEAVTVAP
ncbi:MAG: hypothetical protein PHR35_04740 [Kiritimatiellae bacterium]|nr:hypothetical protein [Kiritimatiellia bacterium]